jgi:hypothetical protein
MDNIASRALARFVTLTIVTCAAASCTVNAWQIAIHNNAADPSLHAAPDDKDDTAPRPPNLLVIGASSLTSPVRLTELLRAMFESNEISMHIEGKYPQLDKVGAMLSSKPVWDYVVMDAWHLGRGPGEGGRASVPPEFPKAVAAFVKQVRAHSPKCKIILFPWWIPGGPKATNEGAMEVFDSCVEQAKLNKIWVATTGPAFMKAHLERPGLSISQSKTDAHPGIHGAYLNACSLFALITDTSPVGLPAELRITGSGGKKEV